MENPPSLSRYFTDAGNAVEANKLLQLSEPASSYEYVLRAITCTLLGQQTKTVSQKTVWSNVFFTIYARWSLSPFYRASAQQC